MENKINKVYLITGSNLGNQLENLATAKHLINDQVGVIITNSSVYETEPWGISAQPTFYNQVLLIETNLNAPIILEKILNIEKEMGRVRHRKYGSRVIDIDILFFNDGIYESADLIVPHPRIIERNFVLCPLAEIAPYFVHPVFKKTIRQLSLESKDHLLVTKLKAE